MTPTNRIGQPPEKVMKSVPPNHTTSFLPVAGLGSGAYSAKQTMAEDEDIATARYIASKKASRYLVTCNVKAT